MSGQRTPANVVVIGLTGGISTGKTLASKFFEEECGAVVLNADLFGHEAYKPGTKCIEQLIGHFGKVIIDESTGAVDRTKLGPIVFSDPKQMEALNAIVWPSIRDLLHTRIFQEAEKLKNKLNLIVVEAAVMIEAKWMDIVDEVWVIMTEIDIAKERLMKRNNLSEEAALTRIKSQITNEERTKYANIIVRNDGDEKLYRENLGKQKTALETRYAKLSAFELVTIVDEQDQVITSAKRAVVRAFNLMHRCSYVVVRHSVSGKYFVQERSRLKDSGPGLLDPAPGGVLGYNETYLANAKREMSEEMGLANIELEHICALRYEDSKGKFWGTIFFTSADTNVNDLKLQAEEVASVKLMSKDEILGMAPERFLPCGLQAFKKYCSLRDA